MGTAFAQRSGSELPEANELREPPPADSPVRPARVRAQSFEKDGEDAQAELSDAQLNFSPHTDTEDPSQPWLLSDEVQDRQDGRADHDQAAAGKGSSSPTNAKEEWWQQQLLAQQRESEERTRTLRESTLVASLQSKSSATETKAKAATKASASESAEAPDQEGPAKTAPAAATLSPPTAPPRLPDLRSLEQSPGTSLSRTRQSMSSGDVDAILANLSNHDNDEESTEDEVSGDWV